jgi:hypoxanthine phosphoribosyltransferase
MRTHPVAAPPASEKAVLGFADVAARLRAFAFPAVEHVVGIGSGGAVPAALVAQHLRVDLTMLWLNYRAEDNTPRHPAPRVLAPPDARLAGLAGGRVLLVDDVSVSGATLRAAQALLPAACTVFTFVLKGHADYILFPEVERCVSWPWKPEPPV